MTTKSRDPSLTRASSRRKAGKHVIAEKAKSATGRKTATPRKAAAKTIEPAPLTFIDVTMRNAIAIVALTRPAVHNAFNATLIDELTEVFTALDTDPTVRVIVLMAAGKSFCAGADLNWMKEMSGYSPAQNLADANALARMLKTVNGVSKPTVARVHGNAFGGGVGLIACCDIAVAAHEAEFALSETKLGLIPATVGPYVVEAIGARYARRYFLTGERFTAAEAFRIGLVHDIAPLADLDARVNEILGALLVAGPAAQMECKALIRGVAHKPIDDLVIAGTARHIASVRASVEGKEGVAAFLAKRRPDWLPDEGA